MILQLRFLSSSPWVDQHFSTSMEASLGNMQTKIYLFWRFLKLAGLGGPDKVTLFWSQRFGLADEWHWHWVSGMKSRLTRTFVWPALNSTRVRFLIKSQFVNRCNADNEYSPEFIAPPKSCIFSVLFVSQCRKVRTALSKLAGRQVGMASPPLPPLLSPQLATINDCPPVSSS